MEDRGSGRAVENRLFCIAEQRKPMPESLLINRRDLDFQLFEVLQAEALAQRPRHADHSRETFAAALDTAHAIAEEKFAPHNRASDENEPRFENGREIGR